MDLLLDYLVCVINITAKKPRPTAVPLSVWNNQIGTISEGDRVQVHDARVRNYRGEIQLSLSRKAGGLTVIESGINAPIL